MKQMISLVAPIWKSSLGNYSCAFFRKPEGEGKIFFFYQTGKYASIFPVLEDGSISRNGRGSDAPSSEEKVDIMSQDNLGITEIIWAND